MIRLYLPNIKSLEPQTTTKLKTMQLRRGDRMKDDEYDSKKCI